MAPAPRGMRGGLRQPPMAPRRRLVASARAAQRQSRSLREGDGFVLVVGRLWPALERLRTDPLPRFGERRPLRHHQWHRRIHCPQALTREPAQLPVPRRGVQRHRQHVIPHQPRRQQPRPPLQPTRLHERPIYRRRPNERHQEPEPKQARNRQLTLQLPRARRVSGAGEGHSVSAGEHVDAALEGPASA